jgi:hypothetical protein
MCLFAVAAAALIPRELSHHAQFESTEVDSRYTEFEALLESLATASVSFLLESSAVNNPESFREEATTASARRKAPEAVRPPHKSLA